MKSIIFPSDFLTSERTAFKRSSNSPLYFAPAIKAPISSENSLRFFKLSGTSPFIIRIANPSAIAVLPTPASPIRTGLFLVLRERILTTFLISSSLPITGSILCCFALSTRSVPYLFKTSYVDSGLSLVTLALPRICIRADKKLSFVIPLSFKISETSLEGFSMIPYNKCSTDINSSFISFAFFSAKFNTSDKS